MFSVEGGNGSDRARAAESAEPLAIVPGEVSGGRGMEVVEEIWASLSAVQRRLDVEIGRRDNLYAAAEELSALVARLRADVDLLIVVGAAGFSPPPGL